MAQKWRGGSVNRTLRIIFDMLRHSQEIRLNIPSSQDGKGKEAPATGSPTPTPPSPQTDVEASAYPRIPRGTDVNRRSNLSDQEGLDTFGDQSRLLFVQADVNIDAGGML